MNARIPAAAAGYASPPGKRAGQLRAATLSVALWAFIGVATMLFTLFIAAYVMRMDASDWSPIVMPWQLWLSTLLLIAASVMMHLASRAARLVAARNLLAAGGIFGLVFL